MGRSQTRKRRESWQRTGEVVVTQEARGHRQEGGQGALEE
jgi:hypothetical protein